MIESSQQLITNEQLLKVITEVVPERFLISLKQETITTACDGREVTYLTIYFNNKHAFEAFHEITKAFLVKNVFQGFLRDKNHYSLCLLQPAKVLHYLDCDENHKNYSRKKFEEIFVKSVCRELRAKFETQKYAFSATILNFLKIYELQLLKARTYFELEILTRVNDDLNVAINNYFNDKSILNILNGYFYGHSLLSALQEQRVNEHIDFLEKNKKYCCGLFTSSRYQTELEVIAKLKENLLKPRLDKDLVFYVNEARANLGINAVTRGYTSDFLCQLLITTACSNEKTPLLIH